VPDADARAKGSIDVTNLFQTLVGNAERQQAIENKRRLELGVGLSDDIDDITPDDDFDKDEISAFGDDGRVSFLEEARAYVHVWDSKVNNPGIGYPSCSRALARKVTAYRDPNGYYAYIGVLPDATMREIRKALRKLYQKLHPDGWAPDAAEFEYLREIADVLSDERRRMIYDNLSPGEKWLDSRVRSDLGMVDEAIDLSKYIKSADESAWSTLHRTAGEAPERPETVRLSEQPTVEAIESRAEAMREASKENGYDFFAQPLSPGDYPRAQLWYHAILKVAPLVQYTRPMRVWLYDEPKPTWSEIGGILKIPRSWWPSTANAFAMMVVLDVGPRFRDL
jgi:curved DNA-binding protein CbpA